MGVEKLSGGWAGGIGGERENGGAKAEDPHWGLIIYSQARRQVGFR